MLANLLCEQMKPQIVEKEKSWVEEVTHQAQL